jgi:hypothetical protein
MPEVSEIPRQRAEELLRYQKVRRWVSGKSPRVRTHRLKFLTALTKQTEETPSGILRLAKTLSPSALEEWISETPTHDRPALIEFLIRGGVKVPRPFSIRLARRKSVRELRSSRT